MSNIYVHTYTGGKQLFIVDVVLHPGHEMFDVFRCWKPCRVFVLFVVLPKIFESFCVAKDQT